MDAKRRKSKEMVKESNANMVLKKHVGLIHCENKLTLIQRKICNILLFNALDKINDQDIFEIPIRKLCSLIGYNSNDSKQIKEAVKTLISTIMEWNLLEDSKFLNEEDYPEDAITWNASALLAGVSIKNGIIRYSYSPQMKSVLSSLDIYGRINLFVQAKFASTYSLVLYENCIRFKNIKQTSWFPLDLFRSLMGVPEGKYSSFKDFNRKVISIAVNEINQKSDIYIEPQFKRVERSITAIQFIIDENENYRPSFKKISRLNNDVSEQKQLSVLIEAMASEFGLSKKQVNDVITVYSHDYVLEKINLVKSKKNVDHPGAYLLSALKQDYKLSQKKLAKIQNKATETPYLREAKHASEIAHLTNKYMSYKMKIYAEFVRQQAESIQENVKEKFEQYLIPNLEVFRFYKKSGFTSPFVMSNFIKFIDDHFSYILGDYLSFDDYITSEEC
ncbi:MAG: replication initiation protein [Gammaproteobacteria bacterium]|nr:replication initiation protein [Gammaproteobacteria bacterium]